MKLHKTLIVLCAFAATSAYAVDPKRVGECSDLEADLEPTAEARERFSMLEGSCQGLYDINGAQYLRTEAVIRRKSGRSVTLYLPATDKTFEVTPDQDGRVWVGNRKMRIRDLNRGDKIGIYISVDKFFAKKVNEIALAVPDTSADTHSIAAVTPAPALPTTASVLPALGMMSGLLFAAGMFMRRFRKTA